MSSSRDELAIFPLTGTLLLPGNYLPLNIFETRYRHMVEDVLAGEGVFGMIQPAVPASDNFGPAPGEAIPELYSVGCVGEIVQSERQSDGRYLVVLKGQERFRIVRELSEVHGYRRVVPDGRGFEGDPKETELELDPQPLLAVVEQLSLQLDLDLDLLRSLPGVTLLNGLAAALPISPIEKQVLLEAPSIEKRESLLLEILAMGLATADRDPVLPDLPLIN